MGYTRHPRRPWSDFRGPLFPRQPVAGCRSGRGTRAARLSAVRWSQRSELDVDLPQSLGEGGRVEVCELIEELLKARRPRVASIDETGHDVMAEGSVGFELRLVEPLIGGRLVRKIWVQPLVGDELGRALVAAHRRLDVEDVAGRGRLARIAVADILDRPEREIRQLRRAGTPGRLEQRGYRKPDARAEIEPDLAGCVAEILVPATEILGAVADDDPAATAANHLVKPEVFEMAAVGEIDVKRCFRWSARTARLTAARRQTTAHSVYRG